MWTLQAESSVGIAVGPLIVSSLISRLHTLYATAPSLCNVRCSKLGRGKRGWDVVSLTDSIVKQVRA